jgi:CHASE2 domain-containing sensor protein
MRRNLLSRILLGILAVSPLCVVAFVTGVLLLGPMTTLPLGKMVIVSILCTVVLYGISVGYFLYLVQTDPVFDSSDRARWSLVLVMFFPFAAISFWYQFIWHRDRTAGNPAP